MNKKYSVDSEIIARLREEVENFIARRISTPADYDYLSELLQTSGSGSVSATTLKRVWGYINDRDSAYSPGVYTLRALCNLIGFRDIQDFLSSHASIQSREYTGNFIEARLLPENAEIEVKWAPNRRCVLQHLKATLFEVKISEFSRLKEGDIVECGCFTQNAPLYFTRVFRKDCAPLTYIAGSASGITYKITNSRP